ncbi:MAG: TadE/TadG family type IV pilus assembly protein [Kiritimatiellia bacterium]|jgi:Flp pilus assembly protein TadG
MASPNLGRNAVPARSSSASRTSRSGQAALETFIVVFIVCLLLFGLLQAAMVFSGREVLHHAAARAARARAVGFNDWMAFKAMRVASIPNSGRMLEPAFTPSQASAPFGGNPSPGEAWDAAMTAVPGVSERAALERVRVPAYLASDNHARANYVLNYTEWDRGSPREHEQASAFGTGTLRYRVEQDFPLTMPLRSLVFPFAQTDEDGIGRVSISGEAEAGQHASLYLEP